MDKKKNIIMILLVLFIGIPAALFSYLFFFIIDKLSINIINYFKGSLLIILIPALGGLVVGILLKYGRLTARGHGVPLLLSTIKSQETGLTKSDLRSEFLATSFTVISGGSVGIVGPIIEITTGITDLLGRFFKFDLKNYQTLIGSGAAASFSAVFNAPIAAVIFSLEVINKNWSLKNLFYTIVASFSGFYFKSLILPNKNYLFDISINIESFGTKQYIFLIGFAIFISFIGWIFINLLLLNESIFSKIEIPLHFKPMLGGLTVGIIGYFLIDVMGTSSTLISSIQDYKASLTFIALLLIFKIIATSFSIGSGGSGGLFAPMILIGLLSGLLAGNIGLELLPGYAISPVFLALCGITGIFGGLIKAPVTSVILILELFYLPNLVIPLILTAFIPYIILNLLKVRSIYTPKLFNKEL
ncbi:MAG: chloride channel protein [Halanaerobiales bacterium]|nr:chloride channel protein [Halanaerobiales bacterium]